MDATFDLVCLSHLRWDFVYQRPQHLLSRCAQERRVFFVEEPFFDASLERAHLAVGERDAGVWVVQPHLPAGLAQPQVDAILSALLDVLFAERHIQRYVLWYYTPMALSFTRQLSPLAVVYDCMDELSLFAGAPPALRARELELLSRTDLVFTGGQSLYEAKRTQHRNVYAFPSSVDAAHFHAARKQLPEPTDQRRIGRPRLGFYGVIDERLDLTLIADVADARPEWQWVILGPVVKIDAASLPRRPNVHFLGAKDYGTLPAYLSRWDVATMPFARNDATRYISPTKTLEYLAAGKQVISTGIRDVIEPYGRKELVRISDSAEDFVRATEQLLEPQPAHWLPQVDTHLATTSWHRTWQRMRALIVAVVEAHERHVLHLPAPGSRLPTAVSRTSGQVLPFPNVARTPAVRAARGEAE